ncbi:glutathione S-transferase family protein [Nannocystis bainbridge]|uniref:Glutathione S-transferase family protein n=1 Tax=Nannocystis bainbridge TaxID=2995303 RepID=A0ABT5EDY1_9BACT|nr:glutathione S-transferase family protein [Nannocystis bainbridge]MDC0720288.1 glutathione S-transferase family protein [Nannocystis bainbridge]MDC0723765.1 glutathione S-transferase family protein [Nannocystis bainbridge]MDC0723769.1 glutathione S-transferase family protein [Nannocystis bainbridge]
MPGPVHIVGNYVSPYVRKVLVALDLKGVAYTIDPIIPFLGGDGFSAVSPLRRIPVLVDGDLTLTDSTVICEYLEEVHPAPPLLPRTPALRARARWLEEFADTRMGEVLLWRLFAQVVVRPAVFNQPPDTALIERTIREDVPPVFDYLEAQAPADGFFCGELSIADIAVASFLRNAALARVEPDPERWPRLAGLAARTWALPSFVRLQAFERALLKVPPAQHRQALAAIGAPISAETLGTDVPRPGLSRG